jgi:hypothetical protein
MTFAEAAKMLGSTKIDRYLNAMTQEQVVEARRRATLDDMPRTAEAIDLVLRAKLRGETSWPESD